MLQTSKKGTAISLLLLFIIMSLVTMYLIFDSKVYTVTNSADYAVYDDIDSLSRSVDLVVIAETGKDKVNKVFGEGIDASGYTLRNIKILKVLINNTNDDFTNKDSIEISEPYYIVDRGVLPGKDKVLMENYTELQDNSKYVMYLKWYKGSDSYAIHALAQGKYNIDGSDIDEDKKIKNSHVELLKESVLKKYNSEISKYRDIK
jgi:hypothetical protein